MANTLLKSEVITQMINEQMKGKEKLMGLASDKGNLPNGVQAGDTFTMIKVAHLGEMVDLVKGQTIALEDLQTTKSSEVIEHKAKGFQLYDIERETTIGGKSILDKKIADMADIRVRAIEKSLGEKLAKAPLKYACSEADTLLAREINTALQTAFGDAQDTDEFAGIVVNSRVATGFYAMPEFVKADYTFTKDGNGVVRGGVIGTFRGIPVIMSDVTTYDTAKSECVTFIIKKGALGYKKVAGEVEVARNASKKCDEVYDDLMFVTGVIDDTGVVVVRKTIA
ncbi:MAG: hypothetical protein J6F30_18185 [Cellulosilyticum sp.]|nr:hypothetical protein [Cellulosilyticum sp.]